MMGLQWFKYYVNEYDKRSVRKLRGAFGNDGRVFYTMMKCFCHESEFGVITIENNMEFREYAEKIGVSVSKLKKMIEFACTDACDWAKDDQGNAVELPLFDLGLWRERNMIFSHEWITYIKETSEQSEYGRERNRIKQMNYRQRKKVELLNEPEARNENNGSPGIFDDFD